MLAKPDIRARLERDAVETRVMSPEEFTAFMQDEIRKWVPLVKQLTSAK
jgi:tripartite-type tricarboxylate transporter receptor subunit TctC